jgi:hypothetical protein
MINYLDYIQGTPLPSTGIHSNTMVVNSPETFIKVSNVDDMTKATT